jgi:hypothetical protein
VNNGNGKTTISIDDVKFDGSIYPREKPSTSTIDEYADALAAGAKFPPIILEEGTNRLLDGYHRWKAHKKLVENPSLLDSKDNHSFDQIEVEFHVIPEGIIPRLYAYSLSSTHGLRPKTGDAKTTAEEQYQKMPGTPMTALCQYLGVSNKTAKSYVQHLIAQFEETRRTAIMRLDALGWSQQEVADRLKSLWPDAKGTTQMGISRALNDLGETGNFPNRLKADLDKGHDPATVAKRYGLPDIMAWRVALDGLDDSTRFDRLGMKIQPYDVWQIASCHDLMGDKHPGRIPGQLICQVLYFYTQPGDWVVDPMVGSGTTLDACLLMGRKCYGFDIDQRHERCDIIPHNIMADGWSPLTEKANLIFWDPPYFEKMDSNNIGKDGYIEGSISKLDRAEYLKFFATRLAEAKQMVRKGTRLAFLMADWDDETDQREGIFISDYIGILKDAGWTLKRHIQAPLSSQQVHPDIVNKFQAARRLARLERYLLVVEA